MGRNRSPRPVGLVLAVTIVLLLATVGVRAMRTGERDLQLAGREHASMQAFYIAEAGVAFGLHALRAGSSVPVGVGVSPFPGWRALTAGPVSFGGGSYWVAVSGELMSGEDSRAAGRVSLRSLGVDGTGARRIIEVVVSPGTERVAAQIVAWREVAP